MLLIFYVRKNLQNFRYHVFEKYNPFFNFFVRSFSFKSPIKALHRKKAWSRLRPILLRSRDV